jgi:Zn-dependent protease
MDIFYTSIVVAFILGSFFLIVLIHELGHVLAVLYFGGHIVEVVITPFDGGQVKSWCIFDNYYDMGMADAVILLSGGLAVSMLFVLLGFFKRSFLLLAPIHLMDGFAELFQMSSLHTSLMQLNAFIIVIISLHYWYQKVWVIEK